MEWLPTGESLLRQHESCHAAGTVTTGRAFGIGNRPGVSRSEQNREARSDTLDIKVVDEDGDECVIEAVDLCKDDSSWTITSMELLDCQAKS
jgi:hypothetical protein